MTESTKTNRNPIKRACFAALGVICVVVAWFGAILPGIPTVGPLLLASLFFTKSFPALEERLIRNRFFAKYLPFLDGSKEMSRKAKVTTILTMWTSIAISCTILYLTGTGRWWAFTIIVLSGCVGTPFIWRFGKKRNRSSASAKEGNDN